MRPRARPPVSWRPVQEAPPAYGMPEPRPWRPHRYDNAPPREDHSRFYHPEIQQRKHPPPEQFWFTHPPPPPPPQHHPHFPPPPPSHLPPPPPPPPLFPPQPSHTHLPPPPPPHPPPPPPHPHPPHPHPHPYHPPHSYGTATQQEQGSSASLEQEQRVGHGALSGGPYQRDDVMQPPSHHIHRTATTADTERVSAVDLIKMYRGTTDEDEDDEEDGDKRNCWLEREETSESQQRGPAMSESLPHSPPPLSEEKGCGLEEEEGEGEGSRQSDLVQGEGTLGETGEAESNTVETEREGESGVRSNPWITETEGDIEAYFGDSFVAEVHKFVQRNLEAFHTVTKETLTMETAPTLHNLKSEASFKYAEPEALEYHMQVDKNIRRKIFFELVEPGDVIRGHVVAKRHSGVTVQITSFVDSHKYRELSDLSLEGVVVFENLAGDYSQCEEVMRDMQLDDVVQAVVLGVDAGEEVTGLSFKESDSSGEKEGMLGYRPGRRPTVPCLSDVPKHEFLKQLERDTGFINPEAVTNLYQHLGLPSSSSSSSSLRPTLIRDLQTAEYDEEDFAEPLRKVQRFKWSMKTVAVGVENFKAGKHNVARNYLNHSLDIDPSNVEGLVARGALLATTGKLREGIADFRKALSLKSTHKNARNYFVETQVVYGKELEGQGKIDSAMECYREALNLDPEEKTAKERLNLLTVAIETKMARQRERERREEEEKQKMVRLRKMIEKEKKKRLNEKKPKPKKRKKSGDRKSKKRKKHPRKMSKRLYSSSEESSTDEETDEEGEREKRKRERSRGRDGGKGSGRKRHKRKQQKKSQTQTRRVTSSDVTTDSDSGSREGEEREERGTHRGRKKPARKTRSPSPRTRVSSSPSESSSGGTPKKK